MDVDVIIFLILALVVLFCFTIFAVLSYSGLFHEPIVCTGPTPWSRSAVIAYKFMKGAYDSNQVGATFTEVTCIAPKTKPIGIFYDNPRTKKLHRLRCAVGCVVKEQAEDGTEIRHVTDEEMQSFTENHFKMHTLPEIDTAVVTDFVYTTPVSIWLAPNRVYPRLNDYIEERGLCAYPMIELYKDCKIFYAAPLSKQEDFFVTECSNADADSADEDETCEDADSAVNEVSLGGGIEKGEAGTSDDSSSFEEIGDDASPVTTKAHKKRKSSLSKKNK